jgi:hypothetical protein
MANGCYKDLYLDGSFKGVPFYTTEATSEHGRRAAEGEFPFSEITDAADLGRRIRRYTLTGYLRENSHIFDASALIAACESPGPGTLVHPTRGVVSVLCTRLSIEDMIEEEKGITHFTLEFIEASGLPNGFIIGSSLVSIATRSILSALERAFKEDYDFASVFPHRREQVMTTIADRILQTRTELLAASSSAQSVDPNVTSALSELERLADDSISMRDSDRVWQAYAFGAKAIDSLISGQEKYEAFRRLANNNALSSSSISAAQRTENAVYRVERAIAAIYMSRAVLEMNIRTLGEALDQYDAIMAIVNDEIEIAIIECDNAYHIELTKWKASTSKALMTKAYNLPALIIYDAGGASHSMVAAYAIHNDAERYAEIEQRNPQFLPWAMGPQIVAAQVDQ